MFTFSKFIYSDYVVLLKFKVGQTFEINFAYSTYKLHKCDSSDLRTSVLCEIKTYFLLIQSSFQVHQPPSILWHMWPPTSLWGRKSRSPVDLCQWVGCSCRELHTSNWGTGSLLTPEVPSYEKVFFSLHLEDSVLQISIVEIESFPISMLAVR
jgi:hypothetical protein